MFSGTAKVLPILSQCQIVTKWQEDVLEKFILVNQQVRCLNPCI